MMAATTLDMKSAKQYDTTVNPLVTNEYPILPRDILGNTYERLMCPLYRVVAS